MKEKEVEETGKIMREEEEREVNQSVIDNLII